MGERPTYEFLRAHGVCLGVKMAPLLTPTSDHGVRRYVQNQTLVPAKLTLHIEPPCNQTYSYHCHEAHVTRRWGLMSPMFLRK